MIQPIPSVHDTTGTVDVLPSGVRALAAAHRDGTADVRDTRLPPR
jgi:hypothetical protein